MLTKPRRFQPGEGPSGGILCDCEIFANLRLTFVSSSIPRGSPDPPGSAPAPASPSPCPDPGPCVWTWWCWCGDWPLVTAADGMSELRVIYSPLLLFRNLRVCSMNSIYNELVL